MACSHTELDMMLSAGFSKKRNSVFFRRAEKIRVFLQLAKNAPEPVANVSDFFFTN